MSRRDTPPFRADHVGSLLRPKHLLEARSDGTPPDELRAIEDEAIRDVVRMQEEVGLQSATDGEFRRASWHMDFIYSIDGIEKADEELTVKMRNPDGEIAFTSAALKVESKLGVSETIFGEDFRFLSDTVSTTVPKQTIPSPSMVHYRGGAAAIDPDVYADQDAFWADLTAAYSDEIGRMAELGCTYLQLDDTSLAYLNDPEQREQMASRGEDAEHLHESYIKHLNEALAARPEDMAITTHMCRGNFRSSWAAEGGYDFVAEALFTSLDVDGFFLEYDDDRSGGFEPLRFVPRDKLVVLGLVTTKSGRRETADELERRTREAAEQIDIERLAISPQCGFATSVIGNAVSVEDERAKLRTIAEAAARIWG